MSQVLIEARKRKGLTQAEVGQAIGRDQSTVSKWETGEGVPDRGIAPQYARLLGVDVMDVLYPAKPKRRVA